MFAAGILADNGSNIRFPGRDKGSDFITTKPIGCKISVRSVQVKETIAIEKKKMLMYITPA